jgi:hypothetical protein
MSTVTYKVIDVSMNIQLFSFEAKNDEEAIAYAKANDGHNKDESCYLRNTTTNKCISVL